MGGLIDIVCDFTVSVIQKSGGARLIVHVSFLGLQSYPHRCGLLVDESTSLHIRLLPPSDIPRQQCHPLLPSSPSDTISYHKILRSSTKKALDELEDDARSGGRDGEHRILWDHVDVAGEAGGGVDDDDGSGGGECCAEDVSVLPGD